MATRAPASRQMRAAARSSGPALCARTPTWAQADRWSPRLSRRRPHWHRLGARGSSRTRNSSLGTTKSGPVVLEMQSLIQRKAPQTRACPQRLQSCAATPASLSGTGRHGLRKGRPQPRPRGPPTLEFGSPGGGGAQRRARPLARWAACLGTDRSVKGRTRLARVPGWHSRKAPITSAQDAQYAA